VQNDEVKERKALDADPYCS